MAGRKKGSTGITPLEMRILKVLWEKGPGNVHDVRNGLVGNDEDLAYNTVQTVLNLLCAKNRVARERVGRSFVYRAAEKEPAIREVLGEFIDRIFGGSAEALVMSLVKTDKLKVEEIEAIRHRLERNAAEEG